MERTVPTKKSYELLLLQDMQEKELTKALRDDNDSLRQSKSEYLQRIRTAEEQLAAKDRLLAHCLESMNYYHKKAQTTASARLVAFGLRVCLKNRDKTVSQLAAEVERQTQRIEDGRNWIAGLNIEEAQLRDQKRELANEIKRLRQVIRKGGRQLFDANRKCHGLRNQVTAAGEQIAERDEAIQNLQAQTALQTAENERQNQAHLILLNERNAIIAQRDEALHGLQTGLNALNQLLAEATARLQRRTAELDNCRLELADSVRVILSTADTELVKKLATQVCV